MTINIACGCFLSFFVVDGRQQSALACCPEHEAPNQTLAGILGDRYELAIREKYIPVVSPTLEEQLEELRKRFPDAEWAHDFGDGARSLRFTLSLSQGWNRESVHIWFDVPAGFPYAVPRNCWVEELDFRLANGGLPWRVGQRPHRSGRLMLLFIGGVQSWEPQACRLLTYAHTIRVAFQEHVAQSREDQR